MATLCIKDSRTARSLQREEKKPEFSFRSAKLSDLQRLVEVYNSTWVPKAEALARCGITDPREIKKYQEAMMIPPANLVSMMDMFQEGQLVGCIQEGKIPVSMLNVVLSIVTNVDSFPKTYLSTTADRTFITGMTIEKVLVLARETGKLPIAFCCSIAVDPDFYGSGVSVETLNYGIQLMESQGFVVVPYSRFFQFGEYRFQNPELSPLTYLQMVRPKKPESVQYPRYLKHIEKLNKNSRIPKLYAGEVRPIPPEMYAKFAVLGDSPQTPSEQLTFMRFLNEYGSTFDRQYGRVPQIEDFILLFGMQTDLVMAMHISNGARFIRDSNGKILLFEKARPEDIIAGGVNLCLTYSYDEKGVLAVPPRS